MLPGFHARLTKVNESKEMAKINNIGSTGGYLSSLNLGRFIPEPRSNQGVFSKMLGSLGSVAKSAVKSSVGIEPEYADLLNKQIETQQQMMVVSMESNIEKSKHETQMAAVRNMRVG